MNNYKDYYRKCTVRVEDATDDECKPTGERVAVLPHQCDFWIIGGRQEVDALIKDLQAVRDQLTETVVA